MAPRYLHAMLNETVTGDISLMTKAVARRFDVTPDTVRFWERTGRLRATRTEGGVRLFAPKDVERFARDRGATTSAA